MEVWCDRVKLGETTAMLTKTLDLVGLEADFWWFGVERSIHGNFLNIRLYNNRNNHKSPPSKLIALLVHWPLLKAFFLALKSTNMMIPLRSTSWTGHFRPRLLLTAACYVGLSWGQGSVGTACGQYHAPAGGACGYHRISWILAGGILEEGDRRSLGWIEIGQHEGWWDSRSQHASGCSV